MKPSSPYYSLADLADAADVTPRTIRYYIAQGLLPPPVGAGPSTRYTDSHLLRLRLVRELQRQHLPLAEIRTRLARLSDDDVRRVASSIEYLPRESDPAESAMDYIRSVLTSSSGGVLGGVPVPPARAPAPLPSARALPDPAQPAAAREAAAPYPSASAAAPPATPQSARSQWERIVLDPDIELHVRRPLSRLQNRAVDRLVARARQLLEEDQS